MKLYFCKLNKHKTYQGHSIFREILVMSPMCKCFFPVFSLLEEDTQIPNLKIKNDCLLNKICGEKETLSIYYQDMAMDIS